MMTFDTRHRNHCQGEWECKGGNVHSPLGKWYVQQGVLMQGPVLFLVVVV
jgi:hypothetical protein